MHRVPTLFYDTHAMQHQMQHCIDDDTRREYLDDSTDKTDAMPTQYFEQTIVLPVHRH